MPSYDPVWLEKMYNNLALVPDHPDYLQRWARDSAAARSSGASRIDVRYGEGPKETLDIFPAPVPDAPVLVFIHGGYWRALDKERSIPSSRPSSTTAACASSCPTTTCAPARPSGR